MILLRIRKQYTKQYIKCIEYRSVPGTHTDALDTDSHVHRHRHTKLASFDFNGKREIVTKKISQFI